MTEIGLAGGEVGGREGGRAGVRLERLMSGGEGEGEAVVGHCLGGGGGV